MGLLLLECVGYRLNPFVFLLMIGVVPWRILPIDETGGFGRLAAGFAGFGRLE